MLPAGFPSPRIPADNPLTTAKVELGRHLFFDRRLSADGTFACASCHRPELAFTDGQAQAVGVTGELHPRSTMSLANVAYNDTLTWADPNLARLEEQMLIPMFSLEPIEMGMTGIEAEVLAKLAQEPRYREMFTAAFADSADPVSIENIVASIASFERVLISGNSPFDRFVYWDEASEFSEAARRGMDLFFSERLGCSQCHAGFNFSGPVEYAGGPDPEPSFHNTALYNIAGAGAYPADNRGVYEHTGESIDMGRFRAPTLRNIELTQPYMHDGSIDTLEDVIAHYAAGGRSLEEGQRKGIGHASPLKSELLTGFEISADETADLIAFLESLTDRSFIDDRRFSDPWQSP